MNSFFKPYEGSRPFFFVSYAHLQSEAVVNTIRSSPWGAARFA